MNIDKLLHRAENGGFDLFKLNVVLLRGIPFNKPHRLKIKSLSAEKAETFLPYTRKNLNHLKGIHACALATLAEYTSGLLLLRNFGSSRYRLIMKKLEVDYHFQARLDARCTFGIPDESRQKLLADLDSGEASFYLATVEVHDLKGNLLCTARVQWQLKKWDKVKSHPA